MLYEVITLIYYLEYNSTINLSSTGITTSSLVGILVKIPNTLSLSTSTQSTIPVWFVNSNDLTTCGLDLDFSLISIFCPGLTINEGIFTFLPSTKTCPWVRNNFV